MCFAIIDKINPTIIPIDNDIKTLFDQLAEFNDQMSCQCDEQLCQEYEKKMVSKTYYQIIQQYKSRPNLLGLVQTKSEEYMIDMFLSEEGLVLWEETHWNQFIASLLPGWESLRAAIMSKHYSNDAYWIRLVYNIYNACLSLNSPERIPLMTPFNAQQLNEWERIRSNDFAPNWCITLIIKLQNAMVENIKQVQNFISQNPESIHKIIPHCLHHHTS